MNDQYARLIRNIQNAAAPIKTERPAVITQVVKNEQGLAVSAVATVGDETNVKVRLAQGIGTITHVGETWWASLEGGATGTWKLTECINSRFLRIADQTDSEMPTPQIADAAHGGLYTESAQAGVGTPDANPDPQTAHAVLYLYYWAVLPGSYSVFDQNIKQVVYQVRESSFEEWDRTQSADLYPNRKVELTLASSVTSSGTAFPVSGTVAGLLFDDQPCYWRIDDEVIFGTYAAGTIAVVEHNGAGSAVRGQGFVTSTGGRAQPQGGTASSHDAGAVVELLTGQIAIPMLRPGSDYEVQIAFANQASRPGPYSVVQSFEAWSQEVAPIAPQNLVVEHFAHVLNATWTRPTSDVEGNVRTDIRRYVIARHTAALAATATFAAVAALATIVAGTAYPAANTYATVPSTQGYGNYIGVAAVSDNGLLSDWSWADDDIAPPYPDPSEVTFTSVPRGVLVNVPVNSDSRDSQTGGTVSYAAHLDPGFKEFWLWQADDSSGGSAVIRHVFTTSQTTWPMTSGLTGWFKVTAADGAGNSNGPATYPANTPKAGESNPNTANWSSGWQFCASLYAELSLPPNGNFQDPNNTNTDARGWGGLPTSVGSTSGASIALTYEDTGGLEGNRSYKTTNIEGGSGGYGITLSNSGQFPLPAHDTAAVGELWIYSSIAMDIEAEFGLSVYDDGGSSLGNYSQSSGTVSVAANTWTKVTITGGPVYISLAGAVSGNSRFTVLPVSPASRSYTWNIDALRLTFD